MEDAEQEIFLALFQTLPRFKGKSSFKTFLYRLCRNKAIDMLRKKGREKRLLRFYTDFSGTGNPEAMVMKRESGQEILKRFRHLRNCASCRSFFTICKGYPDNLRDALNREAEHLADPDFSGFRKSILTENPFRQRRVRRIVTWAAAALLVFGFG